MHELSVAMSLLELAGEQAERLDRRDVVAIYVRLGPLSGVVKESLASAYELARESTPLADCALVIEEVPIVIHCPTCRIDCEPEGPQMLCCPRCGTPAQGVVSGEELELTALELSA
jgi:hydrogenase nickel incorporation protein HypA/HybF